MNPLKISCGGTYLNHLQWEAGFGTTTEHFILKEGKDETASLGLIMAAGYSDGAIGDSILVRIKAQRYSLI